MAKSAPEISLNELSDAVIRHVTASFDERIAEDLKGLEDVFSEAIRGSVLAALGLQCKYAGEYIATDNGLISRVIGVHVRRMLDSQADRIIQEVERQLSLVKWDKLVEHQLKRTMDYDIERRVRDSLGSAVREVCTQVADKLRSKLKDNLKQLVSGDIRVPTNYTSKLGILALEEVVAGEVAPPPNEV